MSDSPDLTREELEERWRVLWALGNELTERHDRIVASLDTVEEPIGLRALDQLRIDQEQHRRDLRELRAAMERHGGFE